MKNTKTIEYFGHDWERVSACLNGPDLYRCRDCGEWTRSRGEPSVNAPLVDPEDGSRYSGPESLCQPKTRLDFKPRTYT